MVLDHNQLVGGNNRAFVVDNDGIPSDSNPSLPPLDGPVLTDGCRKRKRKMVILSDYYVTEQKKKRSCVFVENLSSCITQDEVRILFENANISHADYEFLVPSKNQRANRPPEGYISVYEDQIAAGLRFPMHGLVEKLCNLIQVSPSQLMPNAYRVIVGFILCAKLYDISVTEDSFFSLFFVIFAKVKGLFSFSPRGKNFLVDKPLTNGPWRKRFFFLRRKGNPWNCITKWSETFSRPPASEAFLAKVAVEKGIMNHNFRVNELTCKELLVHGGFEPGVPSHEFTFRYLMHKAAVTKFDLLPEDKPPVRSTIRGIRTFRLKITPPMAPLGDPPTTIAYAASPAKTSNYQQSLSTSNHNEITAATEIPIGDHLAFSSEDNIPLNDLLGKENQDQESEPGEARVEANFTVPVSDEAIQQSLPTCLRTIWQAIESTYVSRGHHQKLEKDTQKLSSELAYTKSRIQVLERELEVSESKRADFEKRTYLVNEANKKDLEKKVEDIQSDLERIQHAELAYKSQIQVLEGELEVSEAKRADFEKRTYLANKAKINLEKRVEDIQSNLERIRDSELAHKSRSRELERELEVSEAKRADFEKMTCMANEARKYLEKRVGDIHSELEKIRHSELAYKLRIQALERKLVVSEAKRVDFEKRTHLAIEAKKDLEKRVEDIHSDLGMIRNSELAFKSRAQVLERELEVSEAKRVDFEKRTHLANEAKKDLEKKVEDIHSDLEIIRNSELASHSRIKELERDFELSEAKRVDFEKRAYLANEAKKNLEKRIEDLNSSSGSQKNSDKIAKDAVEVFKSSNEFLNLVHAATYYFDAIDSSFFDMSTDEYGKSSGPVDKQYSNS